MPKLPKGEYHYAIKTLENVRRSVKDKPHKFVNPEARLRSIDAALDVLRINNLPAYDPRKPLTPVPLSQLFDEEEEAAIRRIAAEALS
jgi:hypothetical protein